MRPGTPGRLATRLRALLCTSPMLASAALAQTVSGPTPLPAPASVPAARDTTWVRTGGVSGNYLFGNREQAVLAARAGVQRRDSTLTVRLDGNFLTSFSSRDDGNLGMDRRNWIVSANADYRPYGQRSQFAFASVEQNFELRIDRRVSGGIGEKLTFVRDGITRSDVSLGLLGERSVLPQARDSGGPVPPTITASLARLSGRFRYLRLLTTRVGFDHVSWYRPEVRDYRRYLASSSTSLTYLLTKRTRMRLALDHEFDSQSRSRGARSNGNGNLMFGADSRF